MGGIIFISQCPRFCSVSNRFCCFIFRCCCEWGKLVQTFPCLPESSEWKQAPWVQMSREENKDFTQGGQKNEQLQRRPGTTVKHHSLLFPFQNHNQSSPPLVAIIINSNNNKKCVSQELLQYPTHHALLCGHFRDDEKEIPRIAAWRTRR